MKEHKCKENVSEDDWSYKIYKEEEYGWILESDSEYHYVLNIKYCPFCGAKL